MKKNKKGFTLIEIVACISLICFLGTGSFIAFSYINKKTNTNSLNEMKEKIYSAAEVYLEKNEEVKQQLYDKDNGVVIPLTTLEKTGLVDFGNINIKDQYIVAALGVTKYLSPPIGDEECLGVSMVNSWTKGDNVIYLCGINTDDLEKRIETLEKEIAILKGGLKIEEKVFTGTDPNNYVKYNEHTYRIIEITSDKSFILYSSVLNDTDFAIETLHPYTASDVDWQPISDPGTYSYVAFPSSCTQNQDSLQMPELSVNNFAQPSTYGAAIEKGWNILSKSDISKTEDCSAGNNETYSFRAYNRYYTTSYVRATWIPFALYDRLMDSYVSLPLVYKVHLKNCYTLGEGSGTSSNPYELLNNC